jgi:sodium/bile acid cotransporter 7
VFGKVYLDGFVLPILAVGGVGVLAPATGTAATVASAVVKVSIALLFFGYGAKLSTADALRGLRHWRLHVVVLVTTFVIFPALGLAVSTLSPGVFSPDVRSGLLFLSMVPSTIQTSIVFTAMARGNVAAAVVSASASNLLGVFLTPLLALTLMDTTGHAHVSSAAVRDIGAQLLLPFLLGQLLRRWVKGFFAAHADQIKHGDRTTVLLVVYFAFSQAAAEKVWARVSWWTITGLVAVTTGLLFVLLALSYSLGRALRFDRADRVVVAFCGSKKSLASGLPMASVLVAGQPVGVIALPLVIFHQMQLIACAMLAQRWGQLNPDGRQVGRQEVAV